MAWFRSLAGVKVLRVLALTCLLVFGLGKVVAAADCVRPHGNKGTTPHVITFETGSTEISNSLMRRACIIPRTGLGLLSSQLSIRSMPSVEGEGGMRGGSHFRRCRSLFRVNGISSQSGMIWGC